MCGEMAGDEKVIPVLLGLGLDEFSMSATSVLKARKIIGDLDFVKAQKLALEVLELDTEKDVSAFLEKQ
jgi:phosphotransferase system enzyme I (PtsI)